MKKLYLSILGISMLAFGYAQTNYEIVTNKKGSTLGYYPNSGVTILTVRRLAFAC